MTTAADISPEAVERMAQFLPIAHMQEELDKAAAMLRALRSALTDAQEIARRGDDIILGLEKTLDVARSSLTARERQLAVANKLWQLCVKEDFPWADGSTQDALTELGLLYAKDMTDEDPSERCKNCDDDCSTCYRAVERIEDAAMEKANG